MVKAGDEEELRRAIEKLLDNNTMRKEMARRSKEIIEKYNVDYAAGLFSKVIEDVQQNKKVELR